MAESEANSSKALVIVPTYNEADTIATVVDRLFDAAGEDVALLVVDDSSPDNTAEVVAGLSAGAHEIHLLRREGKLGLASAYIAGFRRALRHGYWAAVEMDGDLSHDPADVPRLLAGLAEADVAVGSRYVRGGSVENWSLGRRALSRAGNLYARAMLGFEVRDSTSGLRAYRCSFLARQQLDSIRSEGYAFQIEMTRRAHLAGARILEIPIGFSQRTAGRSKMSRRIIVEAVARVTGWGVRDRVSSLKRRVR